MRVRGDAIAATPDAAFQRPSSSWAFLNRLRQRQAEPQTINQRRKRYTGARVVFSILGAAGSLVLAACDTGAPSSSTTEGALQTAIAQTRIALPTKVPEPIITSSTPIPSGQPAPSRINSPIASASGGPNPNRTPIPSASRPVVDIKTSVPLYEQPLPPGYAWYTSPFPGFPFKTAYNTTEWNDFSSKLNVSFKLKANERSGMGVAGYPHLSFKTALAYVQEVKVRDLEKRKQGEKGFTYTDPAILPKTLSTAYVEYKSSAPDQNNHGFMLWGAEAFIRGDDGTIYDLGISIDQAAVKNSQHYIEDFKGIIAPLFHLEK